MHVPLSSNTDADVRLSLALDVLSNMILKYLAKQASPALREATLAIMEKEADEQMDFEMTSELLGTTDFRILSAAC